MIWQGVDRMKKEDETMQVGDDELPHVAGNAGWKMRVEWVCFEKERIIVSYFNTKGRQSNLEETKIRKGWNHVDNKYIKKELDRT